MSKEYRVNTKNLVKIILIIVGLLASLFLFFKMGRFIAPFITAFILASIMEPIINLLVKKARLPRKLASLFTLLFVLSTLGSLLTLLIIKLTTEATLIYNTLPKDYSHSALYNEINSLYAQASNIYIGLPKEITENIGGLITSISTTITGIINSFLKGVLDTAISIPEAIIFTLVTILSTYFISSDRDKIFNFFKSQMPDSWSTKAQSIKNDMFSALFGYIRAQLIMMTITFSELSIGFSIIGIKYFILIAFIISIIDALPILGTGGILIPWGIFELITGDIRTGVSLLILYAVVLVVRQLIEPKILSEQIGIYPLVTLIAMYTGLKLIGVAGLIIGPVSILLVKNILSGLFKDGLFHALFTVKQIED
ncbi:MAG: sporulation integral membrane protein YtvI [Clostridia bacterium]|nr:sporulation integral membrane protein YtvI [Clostridia bacterium]